MKRTIAMRVVGVILIAALVAGCGAYRARQPLGLERLNAPNPPDLPVLDASTLPTEIPDVAAAIEAYNRGQPDVASALINRAIQSSPRDARLHYANGLIYLAMSQIGFGQYADLAGIALRVAVQQEPSNVHYALTLGEIQALDGDYGSAAVTLAHGVNLDPMNVSLLEALASAAYFGERFSVAKWAIDLLDQSDGLRSELLALAALINAAVGETKTAEELYARFASQQADPSRTAFLARALGQWATLRIEASTYEGDLSATSVDEESTEAAAETTDESERRATMDRWDVCDEQLPSSGASSLALSASASLGSSRVVDLQPEDLEAGTPDLKELPAPCADRSMPRMAAIDVIIITTESAGSRRFGVNLLDQLEVVASGEVQWTRSGSDSSRTVTGSLALPSSGITYSLNVANASGARSEVVARPTLVALDRKASSFDGGETLFVGVSGDLSGGSLYKIPAGVQLKVIPTFVDSDTMLLAVRASRTLFEDVEADPIGEFEEQLLSVRNSVTANVMLDVGQSLILSGLVERQRQAESNRVPVGFDVPGLSETRSREIANSVMFILTPRIIEGGTDRSPSQPPVFSAEEVAAYEALMDERARSAGLEPSADATLSAVLDPASRAMVLSRSFLPEPADLIPGRSATTKDDA